MTELFRQTFIYKDSVCNFVADKAVGLQVAEQSIMNNRTQLEDFIVSNPKFGYALTPTSFPKMPLVAKLMSEAAEKASVGPMAAVAGVLADLAIKDMITNGCEVAVVENGGEISAVSNVPIDVAFAAGEEALSKRFGFRLTEFPVGVATSSGRFSHAVSFGDAEAATVFCREAGLADAAATAVANVVKGADIDAGIEAGLSAGKAIAGVEGIFVLYKGCVGTCGKIPQIIKVATKKQ